MKLHIDMYEIRNRDEKGHFCKKTSGWDTGDEPDMHNHVKSNYATIEAIIATYFYDTSVDEVMDAGDAGVQVIYQNGETEEYVVDLYIPAYTVTEEDFNDVDVNYRVVERLDFYVNHV